MVSFCPECGGELKYDLTSKSFVCKSCGLVATSEKLDELRERAKTSKEDPRRKHHDEYLDWWQSSKKDKQQKR